MTARFKIIEVFHYARDGYNSRPITCVETEGFTLVSYGFRIKRDGKVIFPAYRPFETRAAAEARIAEIG